MGRSRRKGGAPVKEEKELYASIVGEEGTFTAGERGKGGG